ncbi:MAG: hypothetical protein JWO32_796 [Bacteroidetes bacterium]|nr:hypothetical protein [Bacteroidota bacterium]
MQIPEGTKTHNLRASTVWFDENGILFSQPRLDVPPLVTMEEIRDEMKLFRELTGGKKVCIVGGSNPKAPPPAKEHRDFIADEIASVAKAFAIVTTSPVSKMIANLFFGLKPPPYPTKMFNTQEEAVEWIKQYL